MSKCIFALILVASLTPGWAAAKTPAPKVLDADRYLYAQPEATPTPVRPVILQPAPTSLPRPDTPDLNNANGS